MNNKNSHFLRVTVMGPRTLVWKTWLIQGVSERLLANRTEGPARIWPDGNVFRKEWVDRGYLVKGVYEKI
jgi:hypothetical protein